MADKNTFNLGLTIVALVALVSIVSLIALVLYGAKAPSFATGSKMVSAQQAAVAADTSAPVENVVGDMRASCAAVYYHRAIDSSGRQTTIRVCLHATGEVSTSEY